MLVSGSSGLWFQYPLVPVVLGLLPPVPWLIGPWGECSVWTVA